MKLKVRDMEIETGGVLVAILNEEEAKALDLYHGDRIIIRKGKKEAVAIVDIAENQHVVRNGVIGLFGETMNALDLKKGDSVHIDLQERPKSVHFIKKKLDGEKLSKEEIYSVVDDIVNNKLTDVELAYFVGAYYVHESNDKETVWLTKAIVEHGKKLKMGKKIIIDKHCSGGVPGNRTTMILVPILAAAGLTIPKTSSRSITSPAGTADTMEVLAPVKHSIEKIKKIVKKTDGCIVWGGAVDLASADDKLIRIRYPLFLDPEGMLLASILAKKAAVNSTHVLIDIPIGRETKIKTVKDALHLKRKFIKIGKLLGMKIKIILTKGNQPIGNGIGPCLEAKDVLYILRRDKRRPLDLEKKAVMMAGKIMEMVGIKDSQEKAQQILDSGRAYKKMKEIIKAQGGNPNIAPEDIQIGKYSYDYLAPARGILKDIDNITVNKVARVAGAPKDKEAGLYLYKHEGDSVKKGEKLFTIYSKSSVKLKYALNILKKVGEIRIDERYY